MTFSIKRIIATGVAVVLAGTLAACTADSPSSGAQSGSSQNSQSQGVPEVDRSGEGNFPEVTGGFGEVPEIAAGTGDTPSKILVKTLHKGNGAKVTINDTVRVNYAGVLWDGTPFDSSFERGVPAAFALNGVIAGWTYGLADQNVGDRVELVIPAEYGYGDQGNSTIPGGSTLVFVVDILESVNGTDLSALKEATPTGNTVPGIDVQGELGEEPKIVTSGTIPTENSVTVLAEGKGEELKAGGTVVIHGVGTLFGSNESQGTWQDNPMTLDPGAFQLEGHKIGSRLLVVTAIPAQEGQSGLPSTPAQAQVLVIDVIAGMAP